MNDLEIGKQGKHNIKTIHNKHYTRSNNSLEKECQKHQRVSKTPKSVKNTTECQKHHRVSKTPKSVNIRD